MKALWASWEVARSGALAGAVSAFVFVVLHHIFISNIWFSLVAMLIAGALCGLCVGWTFWLLIKHPSAARWIQYNMLHVAMFVLLGAVSVVVYDPVTTVSALIAANEPPNELFRQAMPVTVVFTLVMTLLIGLLYGRRWWHYGVILLTCAILVLLLGLNVSVIGLVSISKGSIHLIVELFGLILALNVVYLVTFLGIEWRHFTASPPG